MAPSHFRVIITQSAWRDLEEIVEYWIEQDEPERGERYAYDLPAEAIHQLSNPATALAGRYLVKTNFPDVQELPVFKRSYRILYHVRDEDAVVEVLRFWHSHRDLPFQD